LLRKPPRAQADSAPKQSLTPAMLREFCTQLQLLEKPAAAVLRSTVLQAVKTWPAMIAASTLTDKQKANVLAHFEAHPMVVSARKRMPTANSQP